MVMKKIPMYNNIKEDMNNEIESIQTKEEIIDISDKTFGVALAIKCMDGLFQGLGRSHIVLK